jgi:hypothetical protein
VAVEELLRCWFSKDIIGRKGTDFAALSRHAGMIIGPELGGLEAKLNMGSGPIYQREFRR